MTPFEPIALVKLRIPRARSFGDKIRAQRGRIVAQRAADNLLHLAIVEIDAGPEHRHKLTGRMSSVEKRQVRLA